MENVSALETDGRRLYAGTWRGLYISDDDGGTWRTTALTPGNIQAIAVSEDAIYTFVYKAGLKHGMYRSDDYGETWHRKNNGFPEINPSTGVIPSIHQILVTRSGMVIAVGDRHGTYVSRDRGETWRFPAEWSYPCPAWPDFTFRNQILLMAESDGYLWAATSWGELYRSHDNGATWECLRGDRLRGVHGIRDWVMLEINYTSAEPKEHTALRAGTKANSLWNLWAAGARVGSGFTGQSLILTALPLTVVVSLPESAGACTCSTKEPKHGFAQD